jgi:DNA-3-methyladenine glycosylase I
MEKIMKRCKWCNERNSLYIEYHDKEWGIPRFDDAYLFEMLVLESFQAGLSWECVLNKREAFRASFDGFLPELIAGYGEDKFEALMKDPSIIRNRRKISSTVINAKVFLDIVSGFGSFYNYLRLFWHGNTVFENKLTSSPLSDAISRDLSRRGMKFVGTTIIYSFLQAIGVINSHEDECDLLRRLGQS